MGSFDAKRTSEAEAADPRPKPTFSDLALANAQTGFPADERGYTCRTLVPPSTTWEVPYDSAVM